MDVASTLECHLRPLQDSGGVSQYFLTGHLKGELFGGEFDKIKQATDYANEIVKEALDNTRGTEWVEQHIPKLIRY